MVEELKDFGFQGVGRPAKYDWDSFMDGRIWRAICGVDFACPVESFRAQVCGEARRRGIDIRTSVEGDAVIFQALIEDSAARTAAE